MAVRQIAGQDDDDGDIGLWVGRMVSAGDRRTKENDSGTGGQWRDMSVMTTETGQRQQATEVYVPLSYCSEHCEQFDQQRDRRINYNTPQQLSLKGGCI